MKKRIDERQALILDLLKKQRNTSDPEAMMKAAAEAVGRHLKVDRTGFFEVEEDTLVFMVGWTGGRLELLHSAFPASGIGERYLEEVRAGKTLGISDARTDPLTQGSLFGEIGTVSLIVVPIIRSGRWRAGFYVNHSAVLQWTDEEVALVEGIGEQTWDAVERARAEAALRKSEESLSLALDAGGGVGTWDWDLAADRFHSDRRFAELFSVKPQGLEVGSPVFQFIDGLHPDDRVRVAERIRRVIRSGGEFSEEFRVLQRGGDVRWVYVRGLCHLDGHGNPARFPGVAFDITKRKNAERAIRQQWHTFDTVLSHSPDFAYTFDLEGRFTYVNRALLALWQIPLEDAIGKNFFELNYPPELALRLQRQIQNVIETKEPLRDQTPFTGADGQTGYYEYIFVPVLAQDGRVEAVAGSTRDVTEQKRSDALADEDRRRWRDLLYQAPAAIAVLRGSDHLFEWVNPDGVRLEGRASSGSLLGRPLAEALPEVKTQGYFEIFENVYQTGEPRVAREVRVKLGENAAEAQEAYINFVCLPTRNGLGHVDGTLVYATDVTDLVSARKQIEESEQQFRTLAETIPHLAWMAHAEGHIFWYNRRWYEYTGTSAKEMEGWGWQSVHDPKVLPQVLERWKTSLALGEAFEMVFPLKGANGIFRQFLTRVEPVMDSHGRVARWFGTNTDITDQRKTEEELRRVNRELEEFAYVASHDLQEPLRMVNIYAQLLTRHAGSEDATLNQYADFVRDGVSRMERLIRDLLAFSRIVHNDDAPVGEADLTAALAAALSVLKEKVEVSQGTINVSSLPLVRGDTFQFTHLFQNLLSNSLKYRRNGVPPVIDIAAVADGEEWIISVRDNGIGFESQYSQRIFGLFKRLHRDAYPGTGLGLAICKRVVERYGGRIWAESILGEGATFYFSLPRADSA